MEEMEKKIKEQSENLLKFSEIVNQKETQLNSDISKYLKEISDLKNEMELLNGTINNLTEEKDNNNNKISELIKENAELKKLNSIKTEVPTSINVDKKKYEDYIKILKNNISTLENEKKELEEVVIKQESKVNELSSNCYNVENLLREKEKEMKKNLDYTNKLSNSISFHKKEIAKIKHNNYKAESSINDLINLKNEIKYLKKEMENKEYKINYLTKNKSILQDKVNKLNHQNSHGYNSIRNFNSMSLQINKNNNNNLSNSRKKEVFNSQFLKNDNKIEEEHYEKKNKYYIIAKNKPKLKNEIKIQNNNEEINNEINDKENNSEIGNNYDIDNYNENNNEIDIDINNQELYNEDDINDYNFDNLNEENRKLKINKIKERYQKEKQLQKKLVENVINKPLLNIKNNESEVNIHIDPKLILNREKSSNNITENNIHITVNDNNKTLRPLNEEKPSINISQEVEFPVIESYAILENENEDINKKKNENLNINKMNDNFDKQNLISINEEEENKKAVRSFNYFVDKILNEF